MSDEDTIKINGYSLEIYLNEDKDVVIKQASFYEDDVWIVIGKEQVGAVIKAVLSISNQAQG